MSVVGKLKQTVTRAIDWLVGVLSGETPMRSLEGANAYRLMVGLVVVGLGLGSWVIWKTIRTTEPRPIVTTNITHTTAIAELGKLKNKDTDGDGLSDYQELFGSHTSPYLSDSDSDGTPDATDSDPNCPTGRSCGAATTVGVGSASDVSPAFLRQALKASGVPQSTLDSLSDDDIVRLYGQVASSPAATQNTNISSTSLSALQALSASDIRSLLESAGVDESTLSQVDDETLKQVFQQAINGE